MLKCMMTCRFGIYGREEARLETLSWHASEASNCEFVSHLFPSMQLFLNYKEYRLTTTSKKKGNRDIFVKCRKRVNNQSHGDY